MNERGLFDDHYGSGDLAARLQASLDKTLLEIGKAESFSREDAREFATGCTNETIELHLDAAELDRREPNSGVRDRPNTGGIHVTLTIPFTGSATMLGRPPSQQPCEMPKGYVGDRMHGGEGYVRFEYRSAVLNAAEFKAWRKDHEDRLTKWVVSANKDIARHNAAVKPAIREAIAARKAILKELAIFDRELGI
jgi:hypothetical protein